MMVLMAGRGLTELYRDIELPLTMVLAPMELDCIHPGLGHA
jgi:hypothetical protein